MWLTLVGAAGAWEHIGCAWHDEDIPVEVQWAGAPPGLTVDEVREALANVRATWVDDTCTSFDLSFVEVEETRENHEDEVNSLVLDEEGSYGIPSESVTVWTHEDVEVAGETYNRTESVDIVLDSRLEWTTDARIDAGDCTDAYSFQALVTHEIGHLAGLSHTCQEDDPVCFADEAEATMHWEPIPCSTDWSTLTGDDLMGLQYLYGTAVVFECAPDPDDAMAATCTLSAPDASALTSLTWSLGDGTTSSEREVHHTWEEPGAHEVTLCVELADCGRSTCTNTLVWAVAPGTVEGEAPSEEEGSCGCRDGGSAGLLIGLALLGRRRRRESAAAD